MEMARIPTEPGRNVGSSRGRSRLCLLAECDQGPADAVAAITPCTEDHRSAYRFVEDENSVGVAAQPAVLALQRGKCVRRRHTEVSRYWRGNHIARKR